MADKRHILICTADKVIGLITETQYQIPLESIDFLTDKISKIKLFAIDTGYTYSYSINRLFETYISINFQLNHTRYYQISDKLLNTFLEGCK